MKIALSAGLLILMSLAAFGQNTAENRKIDEIGILYNCCEFGARVDLASIEQRSSPGSKIYVVFYEGKKVEGRRWNEAKKTSDLVLFNPTKGGFLDFRHGILKRASFLKLDLNNFVFVKGGFREKRVAEIWIVPEGNQPPELSPTVDAKEIVYARNNKDRVSYSCENP